MDSALKQQISEFIQKSKNILIALGSHPSSDSLGSSLAFYLFLKKQGKNVKIVSLNHLPDNFSFLPAFDIINPDFKANREYIISVDVPQKNLDQLHYQAEEKKLKIYLKPKNIELSQENISFKPGKFDYDLIIVLGVYDLEMLGSLYEKATELFFEVPVVNIDHHPNNEYFGKINLVEITASATSQILSEFIFETKEELIDKDIATCLLAGIISETKSFQAVSTTPKVLTIAARLISLGADQQEIIRYLYKTKPLNHLKLWGRAMARLHYDSGLGIIWSMISEMDFKKTETTPEDIDAVAEELIKNSPEANLCLILWETPEGIQGRAQVIKNIDPERLQSVIGGVLENNKVNFKLETEDIKTAQEQVLEKIKKWLEQKTLQSQEKIKTDSN